jgi:hypothetical protein
MPIEYMNLIKQKENDDPLFLAIVERVLRETLRLHQSSEVYVVQIDHWFDYKWLEFSGTVMHEIAVWLYKLTVPPFHPSRVVSQSYFRAATYTPTSYEAAPSAPLHIVQQSRSNLRRALSQISPSGAFVWYSGSSNNSDRGSLMVYTVANEEARAWYASFIKDREWSVGKLKGISRREFMGLMELPHITHGI